MSVPTSQKLTSRNPGASPSSAFGGTTPFGSPTGGSVCGGTSAEVFRHGSTQTPPFFSSKAAVGSSSSSAIGESSPFGFTPAQTSASGTTSHPSQPAFGSTAFRSCTPFGAQSQSESSASSTPAFGFGSSTPAFGAFGFTPAQTSTSGTTSHPSQPAFGGSIFCSSKPFGAQSQSESSASSTPVFGFGLRTPAFGAFGFPPAQTCASGTTSHPSQPAFGGSIFCSSTPFGAQSPSLFTASSNPGSSSRNPASGLFGFTQAQTSTSGTTSHPSHPAFGSSLFGFSTPGFSSTSPAFRTFGTTSTPEIFNDSIPSFGATSTPLFGSTPMAAFGATSSPLFGSGCAFGASTNGAFGASETAFRRNQFGSGSYGAHIGSQAATPTFGGTEFGKSSFGGQHRGSRVAPFTPTEEETGQMWPSKLQSICGMTVPVYKCKCHEELRWEDYQWGDKGGPNHAGQSGVSIGPGASPAIPLPTFSQSSPFSPTTVSNAFSSAPVSTTTSNPLSFATSSNEPSMTAPNPFAPNPSSNARLWPSPSTSPFDSSSSLTSVDRSPTFAFEVSVPPSMFSLSVSATFGSSPSVISAPTTQSSSLLLSTKPSIAKTASAFSQTTALFGQTSTPTLAQVHTFNTASSGSVGSLFPSTPLPVLSTKAAAISQTNRSFSLPFETSEAAETSGVCSLGNLGQTQAGGFGSQYDFGQSHCGQSSINRSSSVAQPARVTNASGTLPCLQQGSIGCTETGSSVQYGTSRMPVPFSCDGANAPSKPEADAQAIPRGNPRSLVIGPEYRHAREQELSPLRKTSPCANDGVPKDGPLEEQTDFVKASQRMKGVHDDSSLQNNEEYVIIKGAGESAIGNDRGAGIEALMPKLCQPDYYTEPHVKELAAKERAEPGFCSRIKDFVVGRLGYGHIKFVRETDVRRLDLDSLVRFNNREVILYTDESKKQPIGQGLNKPAEVTLLNIKCIDKKSGKQYIEGPKVEKYKDMLKKAAEEKGTEFVSYDPIKGEWKFKVRHFS